MLPWERDSTVTEGRSIVPQNECFLAICLKQGRRIWEGRGLLSPQILARIEAKLDYHEQPPPKILRPSNGTDCCSTASLPSKKAAYIPGPLELGHQGGGQICPLNPYLDFGRNKRKTFSRKRPWITQIFRPFYGLVLYSRVLLQLKRLFLITSPSKCTFFHGKTLGELGTGTVNLFLVGLLKVEKVTSVGYVIATFFKR